MNTSTMAYYTLTPTGWKEHVPDGDAYRKYFANQAKGLSTSNTFPVKESVKHDKKQKAVSVKLVSAVQDEVEKAKALIEKEKKRAEEMRSKRRARYANKKRQRAAEVEEDKKSQRLTEVEKVEDSQPSIKMKRPILLKPKKKMYAFGSSLGPPGL